jgi:uncharacterized protein YjdB
MKKLRISITFLLTIFMINILTGFVNAATNNTSSNTSATNNVTQNQTVQTRQAATNPSVEYRTHVQNVGWQNYVKDGATAGTSGKSYRLEAINIKASDLPSGVKIKYQVHVQNIGWQDWKTDGELAGTSGRSLRLEGIRIQLDSTDDYTVMYRVHVQNIGWQDWKTDGEMAGTSGQSLRLEAIQIKIVAKTQKAKLTIDTPQNNTTVYTTSAIKVTGWKMANISNTKVKAYLDGSSTAIADSLITYTKRNDIISSIYGYGTSTQNPNPGFEFSIDATNLAAGKHTIRITVIDANSKILAETTITVNLDKSLHVKYKSHVQNVGWQNEVKDGELSGTSGRSLRVEALNIQLLNAGTNAKITYRTHVQNVGWQSWQSNGTIAGTSGKGLRIEAIEIKLENMDDYTVEYQVHIQDKGWSAWYIDGETAGTVGQAKRIEAIRIRIVAKYKRSYKGIDVSQFNGSINWSSVKKDGYDFAMIRVGYRGYGTEGNFAEDANYRINIESAQKAGIPVGVYFVTQATNENEAIEEANWVIERIKEYKISYPVAIDIEKSTSSTSGRADDLDKNTRTYLAQLFCKKIQSAGYTPIVYTNVDWATNKLVMSQLSAYDTWIASYKYDTSKDPGYSGKYSIWQYSDIGKVNGILGNVDLNICYKKY